MEERQDNVKVLEYDAMLLNPQRCWQVTVLCAALEEPTRGSFTPDLDQEVIYDASDQWNTKKGFI